MEKKYKRCPICGEKILERAKKCKYCGEFIQNNDLTETTFYESNICHKIQKEIPNEIKEHKKNLI